jgi:hypothetical protein
MLFKTLALIAAFYRAELLLLEKRRTHELFTANLANKSNLVSSLICVGALRGTGDGLNCSVSRCIKNLTTINTRFFLATLDTVRRLVRMIALRRAEPDTLCARLYNQLTATSTDKLAHPVFHSCNPPVLVPIISITQKPIAVNKWLDADYYNAATERLNKAKAQVDIFEACELPKPEQIGM